MSDPLSGVSLNSHVWALGVPVEYLLVTPQYLAYESTMPEPSFFRDFQWSALLKAWLAARHPDGYDLFVRFLNHSASENELQQRWKDFGDFWPECHALYAAMEKLGDRLGGRTAAIDALRTAGTSPMVSAVTLSDLLPVAVGLVTRAHRELASLVATMVEAYTGCAEFTESDRAAALIYEPWEQCRQRKNEALERLNARLGNLGGVEPATRGKEAELAYEAASFILQRYEASVAAVYEGMIRAANFFLDFVQRSTRDIVGANLVRYRESYMKTMTVVKTKMSTATAGLAMFSVATPVVGHTVGLAITGVAVGATGVVGVVDYVVKRVMAGDLANAPHIQDEVLGKKLQEPSDTGHLDRGLQGVESSVSGVEKAKLITESVASSAQHLHSASGVVDGVGQAAHVVGTAFTPISPLVSGLSHAVNISALDEKQLVDALPQSQIDNLRHALDLARDVDARHTTLDFNRVSYHGVSPDDHHLHDVTLGDTRGWLDQATGAFTPADPRHVFELVLARAARYAEEYKPERHYDFSDAVLERVEDEGTHITRAHIWTQAGRLWIQVAIGADGAIEDLDWETPDAVSVQDPASGYLTSGSGFTGVAESPRWALELSATFLREEFEVLDVAVGAGIVVVDMSGYPRLVGDEFGASVLTGAQADNVRAELASSGLSSAQTEELISSLSYVRVHFPAT